MTAMAAAGRLAPANSALADAQSYAVAMLNILDDFAAENSRSDATQRAILNVLEDAAGEKSHLEAMQRAILNVLDDSVEEAARLNATQRAALNILEDFEIEKQNVERANGELRNEIEERARVEAALLRANAATSAANRELEAFSYSVAHDLRAPLRSIDGFSQALLEDCAAQLDDEGKIYLGHVRESAQHMARLIDALLGLARLSRGELKREPADLAMIARLALGRLQQAQPDRVVELNLPAEMSAIGDPGLLGVVLDNLLGNAWKFTRKCERASIMFDRMWQDGRVVYFVRDNGAGFDMAYAKKLFAVFQRLHTVGEFEGIGIGLATVQRIIHRHGGVVWAEGEAGRGATFYFTLEEGT